MHASKAATKDRPPNGRAARLAEFVEWTNTHITGDEKGESQVFLDRLFQAFGQGGVKEAGATLEMRVKNDRGGTAFADLVWKPVVLIEMKKRGADLALHLQQAFDYWVELVPNRSRLVRTVEANWLRCFPEIVGRIFQCPLGGQIAGVP